MIEIKSETQSWYVKDLDAAYKITSFLDGRGIAYDSQRYVYNEKRNWFDVYEVKFN